MRTRGSLSKRGIFLSVSLASGLALVLAVQGAADGLLSSPLFLARHVEIVWPKGVNGQPEQFRLRPATSIFRVDLAALDRAFQQRYPSVEVQEIRRFLPNRVVARLRFRDIVAQVRQGGKFFPVGDDGAIVAAGRAAPFQGLPLLEMGQRLGRLGAGESIAGSDFWRASVLLSTLRRNGGLAGHPVKAVRVEGQDLLLHLESGPEIRFTSDRLALGWQRLGELIVSKRDLLKNSAYLDLRFEDPVIREKSKKKDRR